MSDLATYTQRLEAGMMHDFAVLMTLTGIVAVKLLADGELAPGMTGLIGNLGIMGVLVWHLWYHTTKTYPNMLTQFKQEQEESRNTFLKEQDQSRAAFLREQQMLRDHCHDELTELRGMVIQTLTSMRVAVHDVKDATQSAILKDAVKEKLKDREARAKDPDSAI